MEDDKPEHEDQNGVMENEGAIGSISPERFVAIADKFIDIANKQNKNIPATDVHMIFLYAATRYNAHVGKNVIEADDHEVFVEQMTRVFQEMLRNHLADPTV